MHYITDEKDSSLAFVVLIGLLVYFLYKWRDREIKIDKQKKKASREVRKEVGKEVKFW